MPEAVRRGRGRPQTPKHLHKTTQGLACTPAEKTEMEGLRSSWRYKSRMDVVRHLVITGNNAVPLPTRGKFLLPQQERKKS